MAAAGNRQGTLRHPGVSCHSSRKARGRQLDGDCHHTELGRWERDTDTTQPLGREDTGRKHLTRSSPSSASVAQTQPDPKKHGSRSWGTERSGEGRRDPRKERCPWREGVRSREKEAMTRRDQMGFLRSAKVAPLLPFGSGRMTGCRVDFNRPRGRFHNVLLGKRIKVYLSQSIPGLPCRLDEDNPAAMTKELGTVRRVVVNLGHGAPSTVS